MVKQVFALKQFNGYMLEYCLVFYIYVYSFHDKEIIKQILRFSKCTNSELLPSAMERLIQNP